jgi:hypothetical protein
MEIDSMDVNAKIQEFVRENPTTYRNDQDLCNRLIEEQREYYPIIPAPYLIPESAYTQLSQNTELVHSALEKVLRAYPVDQKVRDYFGHLVDYAEWLSLPVLTEHQIPVARFDLVEDEAGLFHMIESNTCCPIAPCRLPGMFEIIRPTATYQFASRQVDLVPLPLQDHRTIFNYLVREYATKFGKRDQYLIGIGDTKSQADVRNILQYKVDAALACGHESELMSIQDLRVEDGSAFHRGREVHVLYQFFDVQLNRNLAGIANSKSELSGYLEAIRRKALIVVNPFPAMFISEDKSILAMLRDPNYHEYFDADELRAIEDLIPETYKLRDQWVSFEGERANLQTLIRSRKDDFVIKGQMANSGSDVTVGRQTSGAQWREKINSSLEGPYVVQKYVHGKVQHLRDANNQNQPVSMNGTLAMCLIGGKPSGMDNRLSPDFVTNCARGAVTQNVLVYADK